jgi:hypothetical protein
MIDFTVQIFRKLLLQLKNNNFDFVTLADYLKTMPGGKIVILRHDIDKLPLNAELTARIENEFGIRGTYYFRMIPSVYNERIIKIIAELGHEIGYHYETMDTSKGDVNKAYDEFCKNLEKFRRIYPVETICMHGSPASRFDNKTIWKNFNYRELGITGEPYFDIDFNQFAYFTDTGRRWNGGKVSVRDKVNSSYSFNYRSTEEIINNAAKLPEKVMFTIHPQRWFEPGKDWLFELIIQNTKNAAKYFLVKREGKTT